jgi:glycolate oxidase FAD binding subunit
LKTVHPYSEQEVAAILCDAYRDNLAVVPRGAGTKSDWGNPPSRADIVLSLANLNQVTEHAWADLTVTAEAGCTIAELQRTVAQHGQRLAVDPLWPEHATVGGVLSANDTGVLRYRYGGLRDLVIGVTLALADGTLAKSGGKVVKNVAGYDLSKLVTGALGTLGVITSATFRLHPLPRAARTATILAASLPEMQVALGRILDAQLAPAALQVRAGAGAPQIDVLFEGIDEGIDAQVEALARLAPVSEGHSEVWKRLDADAKISVLPSRIAEVLAVLQGQNGYAVVQGTGIGWAQSHSLAPLREKVESMGGSLVLMRRHAEMDAWGSPGDAWPLMRAVKRQFDPRNILNPGCFVGGI